MKTLNEKTPLKPSIYKIEETAADFETAITATGFGKFNLILILIAIPTGWSSIFESTTMSYVFPAAQCDLHLTLGDKGLLNAVNYLGTISSAFLWGFLCDTLGRKKLLAVGLFLDGVFVLLSAASQNFPLLVMAKFLGGFIINGPFAALTTYLSEFHSAKHRARVIMVLGIIFSTATVILPLLAWWILPLNLNFAIKNLSFHSWNLYLCVCALPALVAGFAFLFLPESPKFLMTLGKYDDALDVFRKVYSVNTGNSPHTFPIEKLIDETKPNTNGATDHTKSSTFKNGLKQVLPLFFPPHRSRIILTCFIQMSTMLSLNTLRLWLPQIFQAINDYQYENNGTTADLCTMLDQIRPANTSETCQVNLNNSSVYINSTIVAVSTVLGFIGAIFFINGLGKKKLFYVLGFTCGATGIGIYYAQSSLATTILSSVSVSLGGVLTNLILAVVVDLFPTTLRTMTIALTMMFGRIGAVSGNLVFPYLLETGCAPPFVLLGSVTMGGALLASFLPNTDMKPLQ